jgi:hypothetical protein
VSTILLEQGIVAHLLANVALAALVGTRIHPVALIQEETLAAIEYQTVSNAPEYVMGGEAGLARARMSFTCWGDARTDMGGGGYQSCKAVDEALRLALSGYRGTVTTALGTVQIDFCELDNRVDLYDPEVGRGQAMVAVVSDYMITYRQATP